MELKDKKMNFLGDSITAGVGTTSEDKIYHQLIKQKHGLAAARNYGVGATCIQPWYEGDKNFCDRLHEMDEDADVVVVFGGVNDFGWGNAPIGNMADRTPKTFYGSCHTLYSGLIKKFPRSVIVVMTPCHCRNELSTIGMDNQKPYHMGDLKVFVQVIREVAEYYSLPVVDLYASSGLQPNVPEICELYMPDGVHPNDNGHERIADRLANFLLSY